MHVLELGIVGTGTLQLLAHVVFDGLDVMVDARLDRLDPVGFAVQSGGGHQLERGARRLGNAGRNRQPVDAAQVQVPQRLDSHALPDQSRLAAQLAQLRQLSRIAAVDGRECVK